MPKVYRITQQWNEWLTQSLGNSLLAAEQHLLLHLLSQYYGKHALLIGVPQQTCLLKATVMPFQVLLTHQVVKNKSVKSIEGDFKELPIASASVDLVLVPHTLEYLESPHQLLMEACRIVKPEGHIIVLGFNPYSMWGLKKIFMASHYMPWIKTFLSAGTIKKWLTLADFELVKQNKIMFRPPLKHHQLYRKLKFLEWLGHKLYRPFGGVYVLIAKAKVVPLTPIRLRWQQKLSSSQVTIPGPSMRL